MINILDSSVDQMSLIFFEINGMLLLSFTKSSNLTLAKTRHNPVPEGYLK
jgi:hypothetical protein